MKTHSVRLWSPAYLLLSAVNLFSWLSYNMITPVIAEYSLSIGTGLSLAGVIAGLFAMSSLFSRPVSGLLSDTYNRKKLNLLFTAVMALSLLVYAIVDVVWVLILFRVLHGVAFGISSTASLAIVSDIVPENKLGEGVNYYGLSQVLSVAVGPGLGIWISNSFGYQACLLCGAVMLFAATLAAGLMPYEAYSRPQRNISLPKLNDFFECKVWVIGTVYGSFCIINGVVSTYLVALANERGIAGVSWYFTVNAAVLFLARVVAGSFGENRSLSGKLYLSGVCFVASMLLIGWSHSLLPLLLSGALRAVGQGVGMPAVQTAALKMVPPERRGVAGSTIFIGGDLGQTIGSVAGGYTAGQIGYGAMHALSAVPLLAATSLFALKNRRQSKPLVYEKETDI